MSQTKIVLKITELYGFKGVFLKLIVTGKYGEV